MRYSLGRCCRDNTTIRCCCRRVYLAQTQIRETAIVVNSARPGFSCNSTVLTFCTRQYRLLSYVLLLLPSRPLFSTPAPPQHRLCSAPRSFDPLATSFTRASRSVPVHNRTVLYLSCLVPVWYLQETTAQALPAPSPPLGPLTSPCDISRLIGWSRSLNPNAPLY